MEDLTSNSFRVSGKSYREGFGGLSVFSITCGWHVGCYSLVRRSGAQRGAP